MKHSTISGRIKIAPSVLAGDLSRLAEEALAIERAGADFVHLDVMDGVFVPNFTFGPPVIAALRKQIRIPFDAHLMVQDPDRHIEDFVRAGCNWLSVHVEACPHLHRTLKRIQELGSKAGVAINPGTSLSAIDAVIGQADYFLIMSVNPGFAGQKFIPGSFDRVRELKNKLMGHPTPIEIDGGIGEANIDEAIAAGVDIAVAGTAVFGTKDYGKAIKSLQRGTIQI